MYFAKPFSPKEGLSVSSNVTADKAFKLIVCANVDKGGTKCLLHALVEAQICNPSNSSQALCHGDVV